VGKRTKHDEMLDDLHFKCFI